MKKKYNVNPLMDGRTHRTVNEEPVMNQSGEWVKQNNGDYHFEGTYPLCSDKMWWLVDATFVARKGYRKWSLYVMYKTYRKREYLIGEGKTLSLVKRIVNRLDGCPL